MSRRSLAVIGLLAVIGVVALWALWPRAPKVDSFVIEQAPATRVLAVNGTIRPRLSVDVKAPVSGSLTLLPFDVGAQVAKATLIARIDDAPQRAAIRESDAAIGAQQATLAQAKRDQARYDAIGEFVTRQRREQARLAVDQAAQELRRLQAARAQAYEVQNRFEIRAPFAGVIIERPVDDGQTVSPETVIYRLADLTAPEVTAEVDETFAAELAPGRKAQISMPGIAKPLHAEIVFIQPRVDPATGARQVRLRIVEQLQSAPAGLTVSVNLIVEERGQAISIPRAVILQPDTAPRVRIIDSDNMVQERAIRFVDWPAASVIVTHGLKVGDRVLRDPSAAPVGKRVRLRD